MPVRIDCEINAAPAKFGDRVLDRGKHLGKLTVHHQYALVTDRYNDVSTVAKKYVKSIAYGLGPKIRIIEVIAKNLA